jgi:hypothetical protein
MTKSVLHCICGNQENFFVYDPVFCKVDIDVYNTHRCRLHINVKYTYTCRVQINISLGLRPCVFPGKGKENDTAV